jgi:hypothetical protein
MRDSARLVKIIIGESELHVLKDFESDFHVRTDTKSQGIL